jgi:hypothetical protein
MGSGNMKIGRGNLVSEVDRVDFDSLILDFLVLLSCFYSPSSVGALYVRYGYRNAIAILVYCLHVFGIFLFLLTRMLYLSPNMFSTERF